MTYRSTNHGSSDKRYEKIEFLGEGQVILQSILFFISTSNLQIRFMNSDLVYYFGFEKYLVPKQDANLWSYFMSTDFVLFCG